MTEIRLHTDGKNSPLSLSRYKERVTPLHFYGNRQAHVRVFKWSLIWISVKVDQMYSIPEKVVS